MSSDDGGVGTMSSSVAIRRGRFRAGVLRAWTALGGVGPALFRAVLGAVGPALGRAVVPPVFRTVCAVGAAFFRAVAERVGADPAGFRRAAPLRAALFRAEPEACFEPLRVDALRAVLLAFRALPPAVLRPDAFDRLLAAALRLATSIILSSNPSVTLTVSDKFRRL